jgi:phosphopantetheinyl transferase (holo-ACP synthase)
MLQAQDHLDSLRPYLFQDAHFLVEAAFKAESQEVSHNVFQYADGSVLHVNRGREQVTVHESLDAFLQSLAQRQAA